MKPVRAKSRRIKLPCFSILNRGLLELVRATNEGNFSWCPMFVYDDVENNSSLH